MKPIKLKRIAISTISLSALCAASILPTIVSAQDAQAASETAQIETVVVTARKKTEASHDVPSSLSILRRETLTAVTSGAADMNALSARVPSLNVESSFGRAFPRFYIRGLGNTDFDLNASQPVSLVYDDVVFENPLLKGFPVFDLDRIEILRGPQGTNFGRNTPAGVVKFESVRPGDGRANYVKAGVRSFDGYDLEGAYEAALSDTLSVRVSALHQFQGDYITDTEPAGGNAKMGGFEETAGRIQARFKPNDKFDAILNLHARDLDGTSQTFRANIMTLGKRGINGNFERDSVSYDGGFGNNQELTTKGASLRVNYDFGDVTFTSISGYENVDFFGRGDIDGGSLTKGPGFIPFDSDSADGISALDQFSQEFRLASNAKSGFTWQVGAYYFSEDVDLLSFAYFSPTGIFSDARQSQKTDAWAVFGTATYDLTDKLSVTGGLRYSDEAKDLTASGGITNAAARTVSTSDGAVSWDVSAVYKANKDVNLYARAARGFRAPSIQGRLLFGTAITKAKSEYVTSFEAGMKAYMLNRRLRADISAYTLKIEDQQLTAIGGAGNTNTLINIEEGLGHGIEAEFQFLATDRLALNASFSYNHTEINDPNLKVAACGAPFVLCTVLNPLDANGNATIDGNAFPNSPELIMNLGANYNIPLKNGNEINLSTDWAYKGETNFFLYKSVEFSEDGFWEGGVRASLLLNDGKYEISAYGRNILDKEALVGGIDFNNLTGFVNAPRVWGLEGKVKF